MICYSGNICVYVCGGVYVYIYSIERISMDRIRKHGTVGKMLTNDCRVNKSVLRLMKFNIYCFHNLKVYV